jgi:hypothetical protein
LYVTYNKYFYLTSTMTHFLTAKLNLIDDILHRAG